MLKKPVMTVPTPGQVMRCMGSLLIRYCSYGITLVVLIGILAYSLLAMIASFCTIWMPWPHDTFSQLSLIWGYLLWAVSLGFGGVCLYRYAYKLELLKRNCL